MLRCLPLIGFLLLAFVAGAPAQALAHGGHSLPAEIAVTAADDVAVHPLAPGEEKSAPAWLQSYSQPDGQPSADDGCHCPACHGCCHAPMMSEPATQIVPLALASHAAPRDDGWLLRRWHFFIENPPKTFA